MSDAVTMGIVQALQGLASAGGELTDISYKNKLSEIEAAKAKAKLDALNRRRQELLDSQRASLGGMDLAATRENMGPAGDAIYSSMAPADAAGSTSLSDKLRAVATYPQQNGPAITTPPVQDQEQQSPLWQRRMDEILSRQQPKQRPVVQSTNDFIAASIQAGLEQGMPMKDIKELADAGGFTKDLAKMVAESGDKLTSEQTKTGVEYLSQSSQDARQKKLLDQQDELAGLQRALKEKLARMSEAGKTARAQKMSDAWKAQVASIGAIVNADTKTRKRMTDAIEAGKKISDPNIRAAVYRAAGVPFDTDSSKAWPWSARLLKSVTPHPEKVTDAMDRNEAQMQAHIGMLKPLIGENEDPNGDTYEDPDVQQVVLPPTAVDPRSTLPGANPKRSYVQP